jgi:hypothetical protein
VAGHRSAAGPLRQAGRCGAWPRTAGWHTLAQQLQPAAAHGLVERRGALHKLPLAEIEWVGAAGNYIEPHAPQHS